MKPFDRASTHRGRAADRSTWRMWHCSVNTGRGAGAGPAAVADLQMIGAVLAFRGSVDPATKLRLMAAVATANEQFQSVQPGRDAAISSAAALLASALTETQAAYAGSRLPT